MPLADQTHHGSIADVRNIYCIGRNYVDHIAELKNEKPEQPVLFLKSSASARHYLSPQAYDRPDDLHHEVEIVIRVTAEWIECEKDLLPRNFSAGVGLDLTRRKLQTYLKSKSLPWTVSKSFRGSAVISNFSSFESWDEMRKLEFSLSIDGQLKQKGDPRLMIYSFEEILKFILKDHSLMRGDLIFTGTPAGVGPIAAGQKVEMSLANHFYKFEF